MVPPCRAARRARASSHDSAGILTVNTLLPYTYSARYIFVEDLLMKFELYKDSQGYWRWRLKAGNGEKIASGEGYVNKQDCISAVNLVMDTNRSTPFVEVSS